MVIGLNHQVLFLDLPVGAQLLDTALISDSAFIDHIRPVRGHGGKLDILLGKKNRLPQRLQL
jgi:hypothetical protein